MTSRPSIRRSRNAGQTIMVLVWMIAILVILFLVVFDIFLITRTKMRLINTGDAAALAAARWQGTTLNLIGDLNLAHLAAACDETILPPDRTNIIHGINALAERLAFAGPVMGLYSANLIVLRNHTANVNGNDRAVPTDKDLAAIITAERDFARSSLPDTPSWPGRGNDYANMLQTILDNGVFVGADNARTISHGNIGNHIYYIRSFYYAAMPGGAKQWFCRYCGNRHSEAISFLLHFSKPTSDDLTVTIFDTSFQNAGFFGVDILAKPVIFDDMIIPDSESALLQYWNDYVGGPPVDAESIRASRVCFDSYFPWFFLDPYSDSSVWREWREINPNGLRENPLVGTIQPAYGIYGAISATRVSRTASNLANKSSKSITWMAAAKPFGMLPNVRRVTDLFGEWTAGSDMNMPLVTPAFSFVRLISLGGVGAANLYKADYAWLIHLEHVRNNMRSPDCFYCKILDAWEDGGAAAAAKWLQAHPHDEVCDPPGRKGEHYDYDDFNG